MLDVLKEWSYFGEKGALEELKRSSMKERNEMAAEAQKFADWLALENSREINK